MSGRPGSENLNKQEVQGMKGKMKACAMVAARKMEWLEVDIPEPKEGEVLIKLEYVGICGSDLHFLKDGKLGNWCPDGPLVLGHEPGGVVVEVGAGVENLKAGDKVAIEPQVPCGECEECRNGRYNLCSHVKFMAIPHEKDGVFSEYCTHAASMCYKLPENVSTLEGAMVEPLSVGMHAAELCGARIGESAVILGSGCIGLCTLMALKARGVSSVYVADMQQKRLDKAKELGADRVFNPAEENIEEFIRSLPGGGVDLVFECAGNKYTTYQATKLIKRAGRIVLVGMSPEPDLTLDIATLSAREGIVYTVYRYRNLYPKAIAAISAGKIPVKKVVSHTFKFEDTAEACEYCLTRQDDVIKGVIKMA